MIAYMDSGTMPIDTSTSVLVVSDGDTSTTSTISHPMSETAVIYVSARCDWDWDWDYRDFIEPDYPDYDQAPKSIKPKKFAPLKINYIIKQPGPMRRGNRR